MISIIPLILPDRVRQGDNLAQLLTPLLAKHTPLVDTDCLVVASKVVAKAYGCVVTLSESRTKHDVIHEQSKRILRKRGPLLITETHHGFICANAGVDESNTDPGTVVVLPDDIDSCAHGLRRAIHHEIGSDIAVLISDTFGRPFRKGETNVALGYSGLCSFADLRGTHDFYDRELIATTIAVGDEIAGAAELVMHKNSGTCAALIRGLPASYRGEGTAADLVRTANEDLFR